MRTRTPGPPRRWRAGLVVAALGLTLTVSPVAHAGQVDDQGATNGPTSEPTSKPEPVPYAVRAERQLRRQQCQPGRADGRIDERTRAAVTRFQSASGLRQSGRLNAVTRQALRSGSAADCLARPVPAGSGKGRRIVVSQSQNFMWVIGRSGRAFHRAPIVDNPDVLSPGTWRTGSYCGRGARIWQNSDLTYTEWLYGFVRFAPCGIGFHQIPVWKSTGKQIHPNWWLGTNMDASAGCIRMSRKTMLTVWSFTEKATTTVVVIP